MQAPKAAFRGRAFSPAPAAPLPPPVCLPGYGGAGCPPCRVGTYSSGGLANNPTRACSPCPVNLVTPAPGAVWSTQCTGEGGARGKPVFGSSWPVSR